MSNDLHARTVELSKLANKLLATRPAIPAVSDVAYRLKDIAQAILAEHDAAAQAVDNGCYENECSQCQCRFVGHKRQVVCHNCAYASKYSLPSLNAAQTGRQEAVSADYVLMPRRLTAENGAKGAMIGEFSVCVRQACPECDGSGEGVEAGESCELCEGETSVEHSIQIDWTTIKAIYTKAVELFGATAKAPASQPTGGEDARDAARWRFVETRITPDEIDKIVIRRTDVGYRPGPRIDSAIDAAAKGEAETKSSDRVVEFRTKCVDCGKPSDDIHLSNAVGEQHGPICLSCADKYPVAGEEEG